MLTAVSFFLPYLLGLGLLLVLISPESFNPPFGSGRDRARLLALFLVFGLVVDYLLVLVLESLRLSLITGAVLSLTGMAMAARRFGKGIFSLLNIGWVRWSILAYVTLLYAVPILYDPLSAGDARSIWFFHGKMIYFNGALNGSAGWADKVVEFSHVDYPKLVGIIAAQCSTLAGYWNEYLPKASLLLFLVPALLGLLSFLDRNWISFIFLMVLFVFSLGWLLWDGYMDGYLALHAGVAALFLGRWLESRERADLLTGAVFLGVAGNLKNEGILFVLSILASFAILSVIPRQEARAGGLSVPKRWFWLPVAVPTAAYLIWTGKKLAWGLKNDLQLGSGSIGKISARISDGSFQMIGRSLVRDALVGKAALLFLLVLVVARTAHARVPAACRLALLTGFIYFSGMFLIYLATPADLGWHLQTSARRTMLPVLLMLFAAVFLLLRGVEGVMGIERKHTRTEEGDISSDSRTHEY